jgi:hypothetical protein
MWIFTSPPLAAQASGTPLRGSPGVATIGSIAPRSMSNVAM